MEWIYYFSNYRIPFYSYKLDKGESMIYTSQSYHNKCIIIIYGIAYFMKVFNNKEIVGLGILNNKDIITIKEKKTLMPFNYAIMALTTSFLIVSEWKNIIYKCYEKRDLLNGILVAYDKTLYKYEMMSSIVSHKSCKNRLIQLILFLCQEFSIIEENKIIIPFSISQTTLSIIIGCNKSTINKLIHELCATYTIAYSYQKCICIKDPFILSYFHSNKQ